MPKEIYSGHGVRSSLKNPGFGASLSGRPCLSFIPASGRGLEATLPSCSACSALYPASLTSEVPSVGLACPLCVLVVGNLRRTVRDRDECEVLQQVAETGYELRLSGSRPCRLPASSHSTDPWTHLAVHLKLLFEAVAASRPHCPVLPLSLG